MAEITAGMVRELRDRTGVAMMDCKTALSETGGDMDKAVDLLRKKGKARQDKLSSREAKEGRIFVATNGEAKLGAIVEFNCNTDFTARSEPVAALGERATKLLLNDHRANPGEDETIKAKITEAAQLTGENVRMGRYEVLGDGGATIGAYAHYTGKVGVLVAVSGNATPELMKDLCLHITAARPLALSREAVPADIIAKEREIAIEQAKATGKPQNIAEKIAEGKMRTFFEERVLLDQKFVKDDSKTIAKLLQGAGAKLEKYVRIEIGQ